MIGLLEKGYRGPNNMNEAGMRAAIVPLRRRLSMKFANVIINLVELIRRTAKEANSL
jgi:hypothetical protein